MRAERGDDVIIVLVGNKTDLSEKRQVSTEEGEKRAQEANLLFMETSAKAGHQVKALFKKIAHALPGVQDNAEGAAAGAGETPNAARLVDIRLNTVKLENAPNAAEESSCSC